MTKKDKISFVIPVFNEQDSLATLYKEIAEQCEGLNYPYEVIFVDDGSTDDSWTVIAKISETSEEGRGIKLNRNFGKAAALAAGFEAASGDLIFTLDADLQDDPVNIPRFLAKIEQGSQLVSGWRKVRRDRPLKRIASRFFNTAVSLTSGVCLRDHNCGFKLYRKRVLANLRLYGEMHRFIPALVGARGFRISEVQVEHRSRQHGKSKYNFWRYIWVTFDLMTVLFLNRFRYRPFHLLGIIGSLSFLVGFAGLVYLAVVWLFSNGIGGRPALIYSLAFLLLGCQFFIGGLIAELVTVNAVENRPSYLVDIDTKSKSQGRSVT